MLNKSFICNTQENFNILIIKFKEFLLGPICVSELTKGNEKCDVLEHNRSKDGCDSLWNLFVPTYVCVCCYIYENSVSRVLTIDTFINMKGIKSV